MHALAKPGLDKRWMYLNYKAMPCQSFISRTAKWIRVTHPPVTENWKYLCRDECVRKVRKEGIWWVWIGIRICAFFQNGQRFWTRYWRWKFHRWSEFHFSKISGIRLTLISLSPPPLSRFSPKTIYLQFSIVPTVLSTCTEIESKLCLKPSPKEIFRTSCFKFA